MRADVIKGAQLFWFDSAAEFADAAQGLGNRHCDRHWTGETWEQASRSAREGRSDFVAEAERLMEEVATRVEAPRSSWQRSVCGAYPVIPEVIIGLPDPMRRRQGVSDDRAPLRIFVDLTSSAGINRHDLVKRGVACLALAMALATERPVELHGIAALGNGARGQGRGIVAWRIAEGVLDLSVACNALTSAGLVRGLGYSWLTEHGAGGGWLFGYYPERDRADYSNRLREILGASATDIIIPPAFIGDLAMTNPVEFVRRSLDEHRAQQAQETV